MKILKRSHHFVVSDYLPSLQHVLYKFSVRYTRFEIVRDYRTGAFSKKPVVTYAARFKDQSKYWFHINTWEEFELLLKEYRVQYTVTEQPMYEPATVEYSDYTGEARDYQESQINYALAPGKSKLIGLQTGKGKAQPLDVCIKIPYGYKRMGDISVGDQVLAYDGSVTYVTGVFPQGKKLYSKVIFEQEHMTRATGDHYWRIYLRRGPCEPMIMTTDEIAHLLQDHSLYPEYEGIFVNTYEGVAHDRLELIRIEPAGEAECQCISIEHPDMLYVTDNDIVTHNTFCALTTAARNGTRVAIVLRGGFVDRWVPDLQSILGLKNNYKQKDIYVVRGSKNLIGLIDEAKRGELKAKALIFTTETLDDMYNHYIKTCGDTDLYGCDPCELWELLAVGLLLRDEVHIEFLKFYRQELFSHIPKILSLSATLIDRDPMVKRMYNLLYPLDDRAPVIEYDKYIAVTALAYSLKEPHKVKTSARGRSDYSHTTYESWIMSDSKRLQSYESIIINWLKSKYIKEGVDGQKAVVFCGTVKFCTHLQKTIQKIFPEKRVKRYTADDPISHLIDVDIIITTPLSAGTAQDIPGLRYTLLTVNVASEKLNVQILGRLRRLKEWPDITPEFYYLNCVDIPKHMDYMRSKTELFKPLVLNQGYADLGVSI